MSDLKEDEECPIDPFYLHFKNQPTTLKSQNIGLNPSTASSPSNPSNPSNILALSISPSQHNQFNVFKSFSQVYPENSLYSVVPNKVYPENSLYSVVPNFPLDSMGSILSINPDKP